MYQDVLGACTAVTGACVLPNTGDNRVLFYVALTSIAVGSMIVLSTVVRFAAKKYFKA